MRRIAERAVGRAHKARETLRERLAASSLTLSRVGNFGIYDVTKNAEKLVGVAQARSGIIPLGRVALGGAHTAAKQPE